MCGECSNRRSLYEKRFRNISLQNRASYRIWHLKVRARKQNLPFNVTAGDVERLYIKESCECCGTKIDYSRISRKRFDDRPEIDKVIPELGYTVGNIRLLCGRCNRLKNDLTKSDLIMLLNYVST